MTDRSTFARTGLPVSMPLRVIVDGNELAAGEVTLWCYGHEPEQLTVPRFAAAVRAELLDIAQEIAVFYGIDHDHSGGIMIDRGALTHEDIDIRFAFHTAAGRPDVGERHAYVRMLCRELAHALIDQLPEGPDLWLAVEALEVVMMRSNRAIALGFRDVPAAPAPVTRPVPRPPANRPTAYRGATAPTSVPKPRPAADDAPRST